MIILPFLHMYRIASIRHPGRRGPWVSVSFLGERFLGGSLGLARGLSSVRPGYLG